MLAITESASILWVYLGVLGWLLVVVIYFPTWESSLEELFRLLHAVQHGMEALVYNNHPREALAVSSLV